VDFLGAGTLKTAKPHAKLAEQMDWVEAFSPSIGKGVGKLKMLGAIGVMLPALAEQAIEAGFQAYFPKPLDATSFVRELEVIVDG